jgi:hypothetical protein
MCEDEIIDDNQKYSCETLGILKPKHPITNRCEINFIVADSVEEANQVDMNLYRFVERMSATIGKFVFVKRARII